MKVENCLISFNTDNLKENKDIAELMLIKYIKDLKKYKVYDLRVNSYVNDKFYFKLLVENDFSETDFKEVSFEEIKSKILLKKSMVRKWLFNGTCGDLEFYIKEVFED